MGRDKVRPTYGVTLRSIGNIRQERERKQGTRETYRQYLVSIPNLKLQILLIPLIP
jgi:hypothetical protein